MGGDAVKFSDDISVFEETNEPDCLIVGDFALFERLLFKLRLPKFKLAIISNEILLVFW